MMSQNNDLKKPLQIRSQKLKSDRPQQQNYTQPEFLWNVNVQKATVWYGMLYAAEFLRNMYITYIAWYFGLA